MNLRRAIVAVTLSFLSVSRLPAQSHSVEIAVGPATPATPPLPPLPHPASESQIAEYLKLSGVMDAYRVRWIAALDKNRSLGAPYWPEAFWTEVKTRMKSADLMPLYLSWYQHTVSADLMQDILDTYKQAGAEHFQATPACFKLGETQLNHRKEMDDLTLANTLSVVSQVYTIYKPEIKAARAKYIAVHPEWKD